MVYCTGCQCHFQPSGYMLHIQRTKKISCRDAYEQHIKDLSKDEDSETSFEDEDEPMNGDRHKMAGMYLHIII